MSAAQGAAVSVRFIPSANGPERLVCDIEIHFGAGAGPLAGMRLAGLCLWRTVDGDVYVTFPSRAFGVGSERRYFDYLRVGDGEPGCVKIVKEWIVSEYRAHVAAGDVPAEAPTA